MLPALAFAAAEVLRIVTLLALITGALPLPEPKAVLGMLLPAMVAYMWLKHLGTAATRQLLDGAAPGQQLTFTTPRTLRGALRMFTLRSYIVISSWWLYGSFDSFPRLQHPANALANLASVCSRSAVHQVHPAVDVVLSSLELLIIQASSPPSTTSLLRPQPTTPRGALMTHIRAVVHLRKPWCLLQLAVLVAWEVAMHWSARRRRLQMERTHAFRARAVVKAKAASLDARLGTAGDTAACSSAAVCSGSASDVSGYTTSTNSTITSSSSYGIPAMVMPAARSSEDKPAARHDSSVALVSSHGNNGHEVDRQGAAGTGADPASRSHVEITSSNSLNDIRGSIHASAPAPSTSVIRAQLRSRDVTSAAHRQETSSTVLNAASRLTHHSALLTAAVNDAPVPSHHPAATGNGAVQKAACLQYRGRTRKWLMSVKVHAHPGTFEEYAPLLLRQASRVVAEGMMAAAAAADSTSIATSTSTHLHLMGGVCVRGCVQLVLSMYTLDPDHILPPAACGNAPYQHDAAGCTGGSSSISSISSISDQALQAQQPEESQHPPDVEQQRSDTRKHSLKDDAAVGLPLPVSWLVSHLPQMLPATGKVEGDVQLQCGSTLVTWSREAGSRCSGGDSGGGEVGEDHSGCGRGGGRGRDSGSGSGSGSGRDSGLVSSSDRDSKLPACLAVPGGDALLQQARSSRQARIAWIEQPCLGAVEIDEQLGMLTQQQQLPHQELNVCVESDMTEAHELCTVRVVVVRSGGVLLSDCTAKLKPGLQVLCVPVPQQSHTGVLEVMLMPDTPRGPRAHGTAPATAAGHADASQLMLLPLVFDSAIVLVLPADAAAEWAALLDVAEGQSNQAWTALQALMHDTACLMMMDMAAQPTDATDSLLTLIQQQEPNLAGSIMSAMHRSMAGTLAQHYSGAGMPASAAFVAGLSPDTAASTAASIAPSPTGSLAGTAGEVGPAAAAADFTDAAALMPPSVMRLLEAHAHHPDIDTSRDGMAWSHHSAVGQQGGVPASTAATVLPAEGGAVAGVAVAPPINLSCYPSWSSVSGRSSTSLPLLLHSDKLLSAGQAGCGSDEAKGACAAVFESDGGADAAAVSPSAAAAALPEASSAASAVRQECTPTSDEAMRPHAAVVGAGHESAVALPEPPATTTMAADSVASSDEACDGGSLKLDCNANRTADGTASMDCNASNSTTTTTAIAAGSRQPRGDGRRPSMRQVLLALASGFPSRQQEQVYVEWHSRQAAAGDVVALLYYFVVFACTFWRCSRAMPLTPSVAMVIASRMLVRTLPYAHVMVPALRPLIQRDRPAWVRAVFMADVGQLALVALGLLPPLPPFFLSQVRDNQIMVSHGIIHPMCMQLPTPAAVALFSAHACCLHVLAWGWQLRPPASGARWPLTGTLLVWSASIITSLLMELYMRRRFLMFHDDQQQQQSGQHVRGQARCQVEQCQQQRLSRSQEPLAAGQTACVD